MGQLKRPRRSRRAIGGVVLLLVFALLIPVVRAQRFRFEGHDEGPDAVFPTGAEFHFIRLEYTDLPQFHRGFGFASRDARGTGWWIVDWPDADNHFSKGVERLTRIQTADPRHVSLSDDHLFDYPWIYATQTGWWDLSQHEVERLREYLARGGFLVTDDFWGSEQWEIFRRTMARVLPGQPITPLAESDPVMHVIYDIRDKDRTFIPGTRHLYRGPGGTTVVRQPPGSTPGWFGMYDDRNRLEVAVNFNTDVGDAWEYADSPEYPEQMTALAYRYGINYLVYSMTH